MNESPIEWTEATWNPVFGCTKVSPGCQNCYAERIATRWGKDFSKLELKPHKLDEPMKMREPRMIFVNSMSDLFHEAIPDDFLAKVFDIMGCTKHTYQILTKRPKRMKDYLEGWPVPDNIWLGVSVELPLYNERIDILREIDAYMRFVSFEPLLGSVMPNNLEGIKWAITGGESDYHHPRMANPDWFREIRDECKRQGVAYFHKQNGGTTKCACHKAWGCRVLDGQIYDEFPK